MSVLVRPWRAYFKQQQEEEARFGNRHDYVVCGKGLDGDSLHNGRKVHSSRKAVHKRTHRDPEHCISSLDRFKSEEMKSLISIIRCIFSWPPFKTSFMMHSFFLGNLKIERFSLRISRLRQEKAEDEERIYTRRSLWEASRFVGSSTEFRLELVME